MVHYIVTSATEKIKQVQQYREAGHWWADCSGWTWRQGYLGKEWKQM